jgi:NADPH:quinone reductase-like Zn-dependent oxidoreductase
MKAIIQNGYGSLDRLQVKEIEKPTPKDGEVLVKVYASSINAGNVFAVRGTPIISRFWTGLAKPKFLNSGSDVAGVVEAVGADVLQLKPGDDVFGDNQLNGYGTYAEYVCVPERELALKPENITFAEAGTAPQSALVALQGLRNVGQIQAGQKRY